MIAITLGKLIHMTVDKRDFEITSRLEIFAILKSMFERKQLINMSIPRSSHVALTSILRVEEELNAIVFDRAKDPVFNSNALACGGLNIDGTLNSIKIEFDCTDVSHCVVDGGDALMSTLPKILYRMQRREFFRVPTPIANPIFCRIPCPTTGKTEVVTLAIKNVSAGGALLVDEKMKIRTEIGTIFKNCELLIPGSDPVRTDMQIKNTLSFSLPTGGAANKIGLKFVSMDPKARSTLQRYITRLEL